MLSIQKEKENLERYITIWENLLRETEAPADRKLGTDGTEPAESSERNESCA